MRRGLHQESYFSKSLFISFLFLYIQANPYLLNFQLCINSVEIHKLLAVKHKAQQDLLCCLYYCDILTLCLDPLLKNDFTNFYAQNAFCRKSEMFCWDFGKCKIYSRQNVFCKFSFLEQKSESKIFWILILASTTLIFAKVNEIHL